MYCNKCGKKLENDARFCSSCGSPVDDKDIQKQVSSDSNSIEGMGYGYKQVQSTQKDRFDEEWEREERKEKITFMIFGVVIVVLVIAIVVGVVTLLGDENKNSIIKDSEISAELREELEQSQKREEMLAELEKEAENNAGTEQDAIPTVEVTPQPTVVITPELVQPDLVEPEEGDQEEEEDTSEEDTQEDVEEDTEEDTEENTEDGSDYILAESDVRYLTASDLNDLSKEEIRFARNEIYARHGRIFESADLKEYFESKSWYKPTVPASEFNDACLNAIEEENLEFIIKYEKAHGLN